MTQGRNGCCQSWVSKYRVLYSMDCKTWSTVSGFNVTDAVSIHIYRPIIKISFFFTFKPYAKTLSLSKISEYDQEIPQSQTADNPMVPRGRAAQPSPDTRKTN